MESRHKRQKQANNFRQECMGFKIPEKVEEKIPDGQEVPDKNEKRKTRKIRSSVTIVLGRRNLKRESSLFF